MTENIKVIDADTIETTNKQIIKKDYLLKLKADHEGSLERINALLAEFD